MKLMKVMITLPIIFTNGLDFVYTLIYRQEKRTEFILKALGGVEWNKGEMVSFVTSTEGESTSASLSSSSTTETSTSHRTPIRRRSGEILRDPSASTVSSFAKKVS